MNYIRDFFRKPRLTGWAAYGRSCIFLFLAGLVIAVISQWLAVDEQAKRVVARQLLPALDWTYSRTGRELVTIAQIDDDDLDYYRATWPLDYAFHKRRLLALARLDQPEAKRPRAIFVDVLFIDNRLEDPKSLGQALCQIAEGGVRVFLASLHWNGDEYPRTRYFSRLRTKEARDCVTEVGVERAGDKFDAIAWDYNLVSGSGAVALESAALAMFRHMQPAHAAVVPAASTMALVWATTAHPFNSTWMRRHPDLKPTCASKAYPGLGPIGAKRLCPYTRVLPVRELRRLAKTPEALDDALAGRAVIYGMSLQSTGDVFRAPVHDELAGLHLHAMALDNMITFGGRIKRSEEFDPSIWNRGTAFTLLALFVLTLLLAPKPFMRAAFNRAAERRVDKFFPNVELDETPARAALRSRYRRCTLWFHLGMLVGKLLLYLLVALIIAYVGYAQFDLGPLTWIEYSLFFMLASFINAGAWAEGRVSDYLCRSDRLAGHLTVSLFREDALKELRTTRDD